MNEKRGLQLDRVVLLGRTFEEYCGFFGFTAGELRGKRVLDVAAGVSSFAAQAAALGIAATAVDPIYEWEPARIAERCQPDLEDVYRAIGSKPAYRWGANSYLSPEHMKEFRERSYKTFLLDFERHKGQRYVAGALPKLPFADGEFDLVFASYFLFVYEEHFDYAFHRASILELMRVAREARIYPLVTFEARRSACLEKALANPALSGFRFEEVRTDFEFLLNSNAFLKITNV